MASAAVRWRGPLLRAALIAAVVCAVTGVVVYFLAGRGRGAVPADGAPPQPPDDEEVPPAGSTPPFFWELPADLRGAVEPPTCDWQLSADQLVAMGPTARRSANGSAVLWRGRFGLETGWCDAAARVDGNYTRQPQVRGWTGFRAPSSSLVSYGAPLADACH